MVSQLPYKYRSSYQETMSCAQGWTGPTVMLSNGVEIPILGIGRFSSNIL